MANSPDFWSPYEPSPNDPWDLAKVAHLHRRAGFGATWGELQRDLKAGPRASVDRFLNPVPPSDEEVQLQETLKQAAFASQEIDRLKACWLYRILWSNDSLREKLTLFWHSHFATSNRKVRSARLMYGQMETFRGLALESFSQLTAKMISDPAMLLWLDGGTSLPEKPNENFAREFLELFTLGTGHYTESDVQAAARSFTGWVSEDSPGDAEHFRFDKSRFDSGPKTFLGHTGRWNADDIVRIVFEHPATAELICRKLYREFVSESAAPSPDAITSLANELRSNRYSIRHVVERILRSRHFYSAEVRWQRISSPVEFSAGLLRRLELPRRNVNLLALASVLAVQGQDLFYPPNVKGWDGGRSWLNSTTLISRTNWAADVVWGNAELGIPPWEPQEWARHQLPPITDAAQSQIDLCLQASLPQATREIILRTARDQSPNSLRKALQLVLNCPESQLW